ncbi:hypothetical protein EAS64_06995 [Trebonia kvetii]|uniref:Penicillin-binding protein n=1 Tax=Trebonia kvetii TaxID=2480626 RepID=A0A6P2CAT5_9ACTN|nr:penicillin-binding transpeptidase domain-containing protein [Trebonia kvetii]TVZ07061.1 hypothetical protein EAS64_06995 [Trebonia kvetii]
MPDQGTLPDQAPPRPPGAPAPGRASGGRRGHRHRKPVGRGSFLSRKQRLAAISLLVVATFCVGFTNGFGSEASAEPTVQAFLFDWQSGHYAEAAALTTGGAALVSTQLAAAYSNLDASNRFFAMGKVTQHGDKAIASFRATVDLAQAGQQWVYTGQFKLISRDGHWLVDWAPSVINPGLGAGDRLAVVTAYPQRAGIQDMGGRPLIVKSADYRIGVRPGELKNATATAQDFSDVTGLSEQQVVGQIKAAPPSDFLSLLTLSPAEFTALWPRLSKVPGLSHQLRNERLFSSPAQEAVGQVGTEDSAELRAEGAAYQPGMTVGLGGLQQLYQDELTGTPTTSVVVVNAAGHTVATLWNSPGGHAGTPVRTTLDSKQQTAAMTALAAQSNSAEIVALDARTGAIRVLASRQGSQGTLPSGGTLDAKVEPGMAFSIVSAAALLSKGIGMKHPLPCEPVANVGGQTFTYQLVTSTTATLASDFADGCGTAFANMSRTLTPQQLTAAERAFGIGAKWQLPLSAFSGSAPVVSGAADVAAQATGAGGVLMSPLGMATVAAEVAAGTGHSPVLLSTDQSTTWQAPLSGKQLTELRALMRLAVKKGSAHAANISGAPVYGQAGVVKAGKHSYLSWFVGYRGGLAISVLETGSTPHQAAAALAGAFLKAIG